MALETTITRHSALRSRLTDTGGLLAQVIEPVPSLSWNEGSDAIVVAELSTERPHEHELRLRLPATIVDAASFMTLAHELADQLAKRSLSEDPVQFFEFADWRNALLESGRTTLVPLPQERAASKRFDYRVHRAVEVLRPGVADGMAQAAEQMRVAPQDCVLASWIVTLARRMSGEAADVRVATDYRSFDPGLAGLVGRTTAYVPLTIKCGLNGTFEQLAAAVASARAKLRETDVEVGSVPRSGGVGFDVDLCPKTVRVGHTRVDLITADACAEPLALRLTWAPSTASITLTAEDGWGSRSGTERTLEGLVACLATAVGSVCSPIGKLPVMGPNEKTWLDELAVGPPERSSELLPEKILAAARRWPDRRAVDDGTCSWSFSDLVARAHRVVAAIRRHVGRDAIVAVLAEPSAPTLAGMLGVLLSGAAYVPIDPALPRRRVEQLLKDCGASAVLTPVGSDAVLTNRPVLHVDDLPSVEVSPTSTIEPDDLAYTMYTSGSTGMPKGVMITHGGLANYAAFAASTYGIDGDVTAIVSSPFAFDLSLTTLLVPLAAGCGVVIAPPSPQSVPDALRRARGDVILKVTPRHLDALTTFLPANEAARIKTVVVGGEQLGFATVARWRALSPYSRVFNEYGPTETVVGCCVHEIPPAVPSGREAIPIGTPIAGTSLHILDENGQRLPAGAVGELYIGGAGVARGYLGAPGLTGERFVPDPFAGGGRRLFRTRDQVRLDSEGRLVFVGRADEQLKIRGYRVEPREVEAVLEHHPSVSACAVVRSAQSLVAFVVGSTEAIDITSLARHAAELLPEYMVPTRFVAIDRLPVTLNGKLDRDALAARRAESCVPPPRSEMEHVVSRVWCDLLGQVDGVDVDARFLEIGGDSLMIIEAAARLQELTGRPVPPAMLFEHSTVRLLAAALSGEARPLPKNEGEERAARRAERAGRQRGRR